MIGRLRFNLLHLQVPDCSIALGGRNGKRQPRSAQRNSGYSGTPQAVPAMA